MISILWLFLPLHISTVLYTVQRMNLLSAVFVVSSLSLYLYSRDALLDGRRVRSALLGFCLIVTTLLGLYSKENAAVLVFLLPLVEYFYAGNKKFPRLFRTTFQIVSISLVAVVASLGVVAASSDWFWSAYAGREFTLEQRLLTQPRVLWSYVMSTVLPNSPRLGLFNDDFPISTSLFSPITTWLAMLAWAAVLAGSWAARGANRWLLAGILFFFAAHSVESTFLPLIMYFEHRNYLPSIGILIWVYGAISLLRVRFGGKGLRLAVTTTLILTYALATVLQVLAWRSRDSLYSQALVHHPESARLRGELAFRAIVRGDTGDALTHIAVLERVYPDTERMTATLWKFYAFCQSTEAASAELGQELYERRDAPITTVGRNAFTRVSSLILNGECEGFDTRFFTFGMAAWLDHKRGDVSEAELFPYRILLARVFAHLGEFEEAVRQVDTAADQKAFGWQEVLLAFRLSVTVGNWDDAASWLEEVKSFEGVPVRFIENADCIVKRRSAEATCP